MGFFKNIKNKIQEMLTRSRTKQLAEGKPEHWFLQKGYLPNPITIDQLYNGERQTVMDLNQFGESYLASDGTMKKLMVANCWEAKDTMIIGMDQYIAFELPADIMPNDPEVLRWVVQSYLNSNQHKDCIFVGNPYEMNEPEYMQYMQNYVDTNIGFEIGEFKREQARISQLERERNNQIKQKQQEEERTRGDWEAQNRYQQNNEVRWNRINNPTINYMRSYTAKDGKPCVDYNGINVNSGDILKIRQLNKVGQDKITGRYLYTGYLSNTFNESDVEWMNQNGKPNGIPVCFSTDKRVEDIVRDKNPYEIRALLQLLSQEKHFREDNGYMNDIGALARNLNITNGWDNSETINSRIRDIQAQARAEQMGQTQNTQYWSH